ncbi:TRAP transporter substrate-binding protein DctP [Ferrovibrio sp.]|uniref:TRAP transporter substrate-binding protein DctP n=1 Tax=Ferrovibrio sp. TaxID=1917215 RepID=UPI0025BD9423|nr:TRAP transporter substrate-binding protein DctP [Ferrovibrio sp.]MBX3453242.1 TRAP transporter substrate-binding protein DctP [Ferrovibrio sp.]
MTISKLLKTGALLLPFAFAGAAETAQAQVNLVYSTYVAQGSTSNRQYEVFLDELSARTNGFVKVKDKLYLSALMKAGDHLTGVGKRVADVGYFCTGYTPALLPLTSMAELPYVSDKGDAVSAALHEMYETNDALRREYHKQNVELVAFDAPSATIIGVNKEIKSAADLKGLKVRAYGDLGKIAGKAGGMIPVPMSTAEIYTSMQTGAIDGYIGIPLWMPGPENWLPLTKTLIAPAMGTYYTCGLVMNLDLYKGLPDNVKQEMAKMRREFPKKSIALVEEGDAATVKDAQAKGVKFYRFTPAEVDAWKKTTDYDALKAEWIKTRQARTDANVEEYLKQYQAILAKYVPQSNYEQRFPK